MNTLRTFLDAVGNKKSVTSRIVRLNSVLARWFTSSSCTSVTMPMLCVCIGVGSGRERRVFYVTGRRRLDLHARRHLLLDVARQPMSVSMGRPRIHVPQVRLDVQTAVLRTTLGRPRRSSIRRRVRRCDRRAAGAGAAGQCRGRGRTEGVRQRGAGRRPCTAVVSRR